MLYLLHPDGAMRWNELSPGQMVLNAVVSSGRDLSDLDGWQESERRLDRGTLRLALRHGAASRVGLAVDAVRVSSAHRPDRILEAVRDLHEAESKIPPEHGDLMEALMPGWKARDQKLSAEVAESIERSIRDAQNELLDDLAKVPANHTLIDHWRRLGGQVPDPA